MSNIADNPIFHDEKAARRFLEAQRWPDGPFCPYCGQTDTALKLGGKSMGEGWFHCTECRRKFTVRVGTLYERSHVPLHKWLFATHLLCSSKKGISSHQLMRMLGVTYRTAWFMSHRIREGMKEQAFSGPLGGAGKVVEADETFIGRKPGRKKQRGFRHKLAVMSLVERGGKVRSFKIDDVNSNSLRKVLVTQVDRKSALMTDDSHLYKPVGKEFASHESVNHSEEEYVRGLAHTNTIEGFFSIFKRGMVCVYQHCGEQHLKRYLTEFDFRYNHRSSLGIEDEQRTLAALKGIEGRRLTYRRTH
jgi:transposase-like protein